MEKAGTKNNKPWTLAEILLVAPALAFAEVLTTTEVIGKPPIKEETKLPIPCAFNSKLVSVLSIPFLLNKIPLATLAAVLLMVGYKLASPAKLSHFWSKGKYQFIPFIATIIAVVALDLLKGVGIGLAISILFLLLGNMKRAYYLSREDLESADEITIDLAEEVSFLNKAAIKKTLKNIKPNSKVIINAKKTSYVSDDIIDLISDFANVRAREEDIEVVLEGFKTSYKEYENDQHSHITISHRRVI